MNHLRLLALLLILGVSLTPCSLFAQTIAVVKYGGGGDWYANPTSLPNLIAFANREAGTQLNPSPATVEAGSPEVFEYPFLHMTGHGNVLFDEAALENLKTYLLAGGFLHIDDNYGMAPYIKRELGKLFPEHPLQPLPADHPIFRKPFAFPDGLPKIHEHDGAPPEALGIMVEGRLLVLLTLESDLGDGWESQEVHNDPPEVRLKSLRMGANILNYVFNN